MATAQESSFFDPVGCQLDISGRKRSITRQISNLEKDLVAVPPVSRIGLKALANRLSKTLEELTSLIKVYLDHVTEEKERDKMEQKLEDETNRVLKYVALVQEHVEARIAEPSTIFGSQEQNLQQQREEERRRLQETSSEATRAVKIAEVNLERARNEERMSQAHLERLELGSRAVDFVDEELSRNFFDGNEETNHNHPNSGAIVREEPVHRFDRNFVTHEVHQENLCGQDWMINPTVGFGRYRGGKTTIDVKMPHFNGDILQFTEWSNMFQALVHNTSKTTPEKMGLLKASLGERPRAFIAGFDNSDHDYIAALKTLRQVYGDQDLVVDAHQRTLEKLPNVKSGDSESLADFAAKVQGHLFTIKKHRSIGDGSLAYIVRVLEGKLDKDNFNSWYDFSRSLPSHGRETEFCAWLLRAVHRDNRHKLALQEAGSKSNQPKKLLK